jgi:cytidine deaminase
MRQRRMTQTQSSLIDWEALRAFAVEAMGKAYAPYSQFPVGAAAIVTDGRIITGCNVENASYGLTLCAECALISQLYLSGGGKLIALVCVNSHGHILMPCGRCRQLIHEHSTPTMVIATPTGACTIKEVLPYAFGPHALGKVVDQ